jgi:N-acetylated-alpha-linked acidic dipeptidase
MQKMRVETTMSKLLMCAAMGLVTGLASSQPSIEPDALTYWPENERDTYAAYEQELQSIPNAERLRKWHDMTAGHVHVAGMEGDWQTIEELEAAFGEMGLAVDRHEFFAYLSKPIDAGLWIVDGDDQHRLPISENPIPGDPYELVGVPSFGFNAYSGSGDVTGPVVYANHGTREDFDRLKELGVDCTGAIVIARYGGNYRGFKAKFAEEAGAVGVLIYTDPADSGYMKGISYPEGGWQTETCIQRGSIKTTPWPGDPLTPFVEATEDAERVDPSEAGLPNIPVQPVGWAAARAIMSKMQGEFVPGGWQGGLPLAYRLTSEDGVTVRVLVEQERRIVKTANVIATLEGETWPDEKVIIGCHHDSWGFGASDATSGMISLLESARSFTEMAARGQRPARTIMFCGWGAEEHGIIGSIEWVEANREMLTKSAVAYINLDMASMGPQFGASASPSLKRLIVEAAKSVPQARDAEKSVFDEWFARSPNENFDGEPNIGWLGGGSDHLGFVCHVGVASAAFSGGGSAGTAYHTARDTLTWYRQVVGEDYEPALMIARMTNAVAGRLANAPIVPIEHDRLRRDVLLELVDIAVSNEQKKPEFENTIEVILGHKSYSNLRDTKRLLEIQRRVLLDNGLPGRPWYRNMIVATNPESGYGAMTLPYVREAVDADDPDLLQDALQRLIQAVLPGPG